MLFWRKPVTFSSFKRKYILYFHTILPRVWKWNTIQNIGNTLKQHCNQQNKHYHQYISMCGCYEDILKVLRWFWSIFVQLLGQWACHTASKAMKIAANETFWYSIIVSMRKIILNEWITSLRPSNHSISYSQHHFNAFLITYLTLEHLKMATVQYKWF